jgi:hypothetical protein
MQHQLALNMLQVENGPKRLYSFLSRFIFQASLSALFNPQAGNDLPLYDDFLAFDKVMAMCVAGMPMSLFSSAVQARSNLTAACLKYVDNISSFMDHRWEMFRGFITSGRMHPSDAAKEQLAILWASVGNTMPGTFWILYYLLCNERALSAVRAEIQSVCKDPTMTEDISMEELNGLVFVDACITESLRLSSGSLIMRIAKTDLELTMDSGRTYKFRKGDRIGICPPLYHNDEEIFPQAKLFNPWRWVSGDTPEERVLAAQGKIAMSKGGRELQT